ncbi:hypothetical protein OQE68_10565 [Spartinivicinus sp. SM1973]|nr:hypothetical protein [Spartinivicinus marinus]
MIDNRGGGFDTIRFEGVSFNQVASKFVIQGDDLILNVSGSQDGITVKNYFQGGDYVIDQVEFANGGQITSEQLFEVFGKTNPDPTGSPRYVGLPSELAYANIYNGNKAAESIIGSSDGDFIDAGAGNDVIRGNQGNDLLLGGRGSDTYLFATGDGQDRINNLKTSDDEHDVLQLAGIDKNHLWFHREDDNLIVDVIDSDDKVTIDNWFANENQQLAEIETTDGVLGNDDVATLVQAMAAFEESGGAATADHSLLSEPLKATLAQAWQPKS